MSATPAALANSPVGRIALGALLLRSPGQLDRMGRAGEAFDLYSLAAFAGGAPQTVPGAALRGKLLCARPGDVLVSRATAEPRRAWVVAAHPERTPVASNEWLILRADAHDPGYLRHLLVSNEFHLRFMQAAGTGGLAGAGSARLCAIELPVPSRARQQALARLLDLADALRARRRRALAALDELETAFHAQALAGQRAAAEALRRRMEASRTQLDALLGLLRDLAFRADLI